MRTLSGSVGKGGMNKKADVKTVQYLLNKKRNRLNMAEQLVEDGICGEKTLHAIKVFQRDVVGLAAPDERDDTNGKTLFYLRQDSINDSKVKAPPKFKLNNGAEPISIKYANDIQYSAKIVSNYSMDVIRMALRRAGMSCAVITSTFRTPEQQAAIMYQNAVKDLSKQKELYCQNGNKILDEFSKQSKSSKSSDDIIKAMKEKIVLLHQSGQIVSRHVKSVEDYKIYNVFDIGANSTEKECGSDFDAAKLTEAFTALKAEGYIEYFIDETDKSNKCWHIEIKPGKKKISMSDDELGIDSKP